MARSFDGVNDFMAISSSTVDITSDFTIALWNDKNEKAGNDNDRFCSFNDDANNNFQFITDNNTVKYGIELLVAGAFKAENLIYSTYIVDVWTHIAVTVAGNTVKFYVNGVETSSTGTAAIAPSGTNNYRIGVRSDLNSTTFFDGELAEFAIWSVALTDNEIAALSRGINPNQIRNDVLRQHLPIYGNDSPEVDLSGNNFDATLTSAPPKAASNPPVKLLEDYL